MHHPNFSDPLHPYKAQNKMLYLVMSKTNVHEWWIHYLEWTALYFLSLLRNVLCFVFPKMKLFLVVFYKQCYISNSLCCVQFIIQRDNWYQKIGENTRHRVKTSPMSKFRCRYVWEVPFSLLDWFFSESVQKSGILE